MNQCYYALFWFYISERYYLLFFEIFLEFELRITNHPGLRGSHVRCYSCFILRVSSVRVLRYNVPREEIGCGKPDKKNTRVQKRDRAGSGGRDARKKTLAWHRLTFRAKTSLGENVAARFFLLDFFSLRVTCWIFFAKTIRNICGRNQLHVASYFHRWRKLELKFDFCRRIELYRMSDAKHDNARVQID